MTLLNLLPWILAGLLAVGVVWLLVRRPAPPPDPYPEALRQLGEEVDRGEVDPSGPAGEPPGLAALRRRLAEGWAPLPPVPEEEAPPARDPVAVALEGVLGYLERGVLPLLREASPGGAPAGEGNALRDALDALEDLAFYATGPVEEEPRRGSLADLVQEVTREYTLETGIPLRVRGPERPIHLVTRPEAFKDALFLLLANAGRWGGGRTVDITLTQEGEEIRVTVADRGEGFSPEALERAFEPFWTTEADALGLGLTHARALVRQLGGALSVGNREEGGGEARLTLPRDASGSPG